jgi:uncharacterized phage protein (TIGR02218 family)
MRVIPPSLGLEENIQRHALCIRIERLDGLVLGFTNHDFPLSVNYGSQGIVTCQPEDGIRSGPLGMTLGTQADDVRVLGFLRSARITERDLIAGLWMDAEVSFSIVNWAVTPPPLDPLIIMPAYIRGVTFGAGQFEIVLESLMGRLQQPVGELTSPGCRVREFLDERCNPDDTLDPADWRFTRTVAEVRADGSLLFGADTHDGGFYRYGRVKFDAGAGGGENANIAREVKGHVKEPGGAAITLQLPFPFPVEVGDSAMLEGGCDRTFAACVARGNAANFQAEPHLPGTQEISFIKRR